MKQIRAFLMGAVITSVMFSTCLVWAGNSATISVLFNEVKLVVDGKSVNKETLLYNGTTYVPLRAAAEALGQEVNYDADTKTAYIGAITNNTATIPKSYSMSNPAPIGTMQTVTVDNYFDKYTMEIKVLESIRGSKAAELIKEANMFNEEPLDGYEYILVKLYAKNIDCEEGKKIDISKVSFDAFSASGAQYNEIFMAVEPTPKFSSSLYKGASVEGWTIFMVKKDDTAPKISYGTEYDGTSGIWFSIV